MGGVSSVIECAFTKAQNTHIHNRVRRWGRILARGGGGAPRLRSLMRFSLRTFAALLGLALLGYLVFRAGPAVVWKQLQAVGWGVSLIIVLGGFSQLVKTCAWRQAFACDISRLSWSRSFVGQLISDGIGHSGSQEK